MAPHLSDGAALLDALGAPPLWSTTWHWYGLQYAIATDRPDSSRDPTPTRSPRRRA